MPLATLDFDSKSSVSLESQMQRLALEAEAIGNVIDIFKSVLPSLLDTLISKFQDVTEDSEIDTDINELKLTFNGLKVKLPHASYMACSKTLISVPEGFRGELLPYIATLSRMAEDVFKEANKLLGEYNFALSAFITNKEDKISLKDHTNIFRLAKQRREKMSSEISKYFPNGTDLSKTYLGTAISRFADLEHLLKEADKLFKSYKTHDIHSVKDSVKKSSDMLKIIIDDTRNNGISKVSGNAAMNISEGAYELGKYVEFISIYRFRVEQAVSTVEKLMKTLNTIV